MKAAVVHRAGEPPVYGEFDEPSPASGEHLISVTAAALSPLARARASGTHYSSSNAFPFVAGVDGTGILDDGTRAYFVLPRTPFGAMAQRTVVRAEQCIAVPDGLDDLTAAAVANPGMSSWAAFTARAKLQPGETVLVNGATGASGLLAVQIAKLMGAKRVIATGRNREVLATLASLGADAVIPLSGEPGTWRAPFEAEFEQGVDVVIDYLWGPSADQILQAGARAGRDATPMRFVQVGTAGGVSIDLPGAVLRSSGWELMGSGIGSVSLAGLVSAVGGVLDAAARGALTIAATPMPLSAVGQAWSHTGGRVVITV